MPELGCELKKIIDSDVSLKEKELQVSAILKTMSRDQICVAIEAVDNRILLLAIQSCRKN